MQNFLDATGTPIQAKLLFGQYFPKPREDVKNRPWEVIPAHPKSANAEANLVDLP